MDFAGDFQAADAVDSLIDWWELAGVSGAVLEVPNSWLDQGKPPAPTALPITAPAEASMPDSMEAFHHWLATGDDLTELEWPQLSADARRVLPAGPNTPALMVICDMPDAEDVQQGMVLTGEAGRLFDGMLRAVGLSREAVYVSSLAIARPAGGMLSESDAAALARRMSRHISIVAPRRVLLVGDKTSRALFPMIDAANNNGLGHLNHEAGKVESMTVSHPRLLLKQPAAKLQCWRHLQFLIEAQPV